MSSPLKLRLVGAGGVVIVVSVIALFVAIYQQVFTPAVFVTVDAERSGLLMDPGARVKFRDVYVGDVREVRPIANGAQLTIALDAEQAQLLPADVTAQLLPTTLFGGKYVALSSVGSTAAPIRAGDRIPTSAVNVEANDVFQSLMGVLTAVRPAKMSATLGAIADTLRGKGGEIGRYITNLNRYLERINPSLPQLSDDLRAAPGVLDTYASATPDVVDTLDHLRVTSGTLVEQQAALQGFLLDLTGLAGNTQRFLTDTAPPLETMLSVLRPTTRMLASYSPQFTCLVQGLSEGKKVFEGPLGGSRPGANLTLSILPGLPSYKYPADLPVVAAANGPDCLGLPMLAPHQIPHPHVNYATGTPAFRGNDDRVTVGRPPLAVQLFGPLAQEVTGP